MWVFVAMEALGFAVSTLGFGLCMIVTRIIRGSHFVIHSITRLLLPFLFPPLFLHESIFAALFFFYQYLTPFVSCNLYFIGTYYECFQSLNNLLIRCALLPSVRTVPCEVSVLYDIWFYTISNKKYELCF